MTEEEDLLEIFNEGLWLLSQHREIEFTKFKRIEKMIENGKIRIVISE